MEWERGLAVKPRSERWFFERVWCRVWTEDKIRCASDANPNDDAWKSIYDTHRKNKGGLVVQHITAHVTGESRQQKIDQNQFDIDWQ